ncbi:MAG: type II toxin-antitoxin system RelE/ParE family toxin [Erysipelotrichaceae bacterium]|nr:type II toxin-antitoxin system RelE/ParE family toxin [Erysipelotrichaceae bacterium]MDY5251486.1 type II toxin-antitoxin system RelE/ParE family toxin [Erysipelotrichaceae bacterium]
MWDVKYLPEALDDLDELDGSQRKLVLKSIEKVRKNPLSQQEGAYGKLLGKRGNTDLTGFLKIKLRVSGLRLVYKVIKQEDRMLIVVIGAREDEEVYSIAEKRIKKNDL